jgi:hypothetical protein
MSKRFPLHGTDKSDAKRSPKAKQLTRAYRQNREIKSRETVITAVPNTVYSRIDYGIVR